MITFLRIQLALEKLTIFYHHYFPAAKVSWLNGCQPQLKHEGKKVRSSAQLIVPEKTWVSSPIAGKV